MATTVEDMTTKNKYAVTEDERKRINQATATKYSLNLQPGESLELDVERDAEHGNVRVTLTNNDDTLRVELEAAVLSSDEHLAPPSIEERLYVAIDFVDAMLESYFEDRDTRYHSDWRIYDFEHAQVRFRGSITRPNLEALADAWLAAEGEPGESN